MRPQKRFQINHYLPEHLPDSPEFRCFKLLGNFSIILNKQHYCYKNNSQKCKAGYHSFHIGNRLSHNHRHNIRLEIICKNRNLLNHKALQLLSIEAEQPFQIITATGKRGFPIGKIIRDPTPEISPSIHHNVTENPEDPDKKHHPYHKEKPCHKGFFKSGVLMDALNKRVHCPDDQKSC